MLELLMILLGLNFGNNNTLPADAGTNNCHPTEAGQTTYTNPPDTGGETQPIPPRK